MKADIRDFIWYDPDVGVESLHIWGLPGSGKSNLALHLVDLAMKGTQDKVLLRGDRFAEWQHFLLRPNTKLHLVIPAEAAGKYRYIIPKGSHPSVEEMHYWLEQEYKVTVTTDDSYEYIQNNPMSYFENHDIVILMDVNFPLGQKGWFWSKVFRSLLNRFEFTDRAITYLDHEAGILFPEIALSESKEAKNHWKAVNDVCESFVDFRKGLIRTILISQLEGEINWRIRQKCMYSIIKQGIAGRNMPKQIIKEAPRQRIDQFICVIGRELFTRENIAPKYPEISPRLKVIPLDVIELIEPEKEEEDTHECLNCGHTWRARVSYPKQCPNCKTTKKSIQEIEI